MVHTVGQPAAWRKIDHRPVDGELWILHQNPDDPLRFVHATRDLTLTPPDRFVHDFGSIPRVAQLIIGGPAGHPDFAQHAGKVYPLHDWAYEWGRWDQGTPMSRRTADLILYSALLWVHCTEEYVRAVYRAVRAGGGRHWRDHRNGTIPVSTYGRG